MYPAPTAPAASDRPAGRAALRAARRERGWSQADAARELAAAAARAGADVATPASLKTQLSRWENGHAAPDPEYRALLASLYRRAPAELGLVPAGPDAAPSQPDPWGPLRARLAEAAAVDDTALDLLREQFAATVGLDRRLGTAAAADALAAQVDRLEVLADHTPADPRRGAVHALLAEAALLAGDQERDRERPLRAWARYGLARAAAGEAARPDLAARARAGRARVLLDANLPGQARELLGEATGTGPGPRRTPDTAHAGPGPAFELAHPHLADPGRADAEGHPETAEELRRAAEDERRPVRERAEALAALAATLGRAGRSAEAAGHARRAQLLALRIGSARVASLVAGPAGEVAAEPAADAGSGR